MPQPIDEAAVRAVLADFKDPETGRSVTQMEQIRDLTVKGDSVALTLALSTHSAPLWQETKQELIEQLQKRLPQASPSMCGWPSTRAPRHGRGRWA